MLSLCLSLSPSPFLPPSLSPSLPPSLSIPVSRSLSISLSLSLSPSSPLTLLRRDSDGHTQHDGNETTQQKASIGQKSSGSQHLPLVSYTHLTLPTRRTV